ncbi:S-layer family protein [Planktothrix sp. FACHB-1355]|uniref:S-layer family protein n=1 Tax=Aerosakkonema funiforme FACHB-1375 TaxID=2949571 RepID=A0A926ZF33_9CYAN|nr:MULTISPECIES: S-layer family protein [Oscillatoriales]MBD2180440.1 S-layer family protein [Aerosakkonema funiforme FACHB-1375]MBD3561435.1 S-layer family protein [Planktothrix sp. FACHB-1355]
MPSGRIELSSVKDSFVSLTPNLTVGYENVSNFGDIQLSGGARVNTSGIGGGSIRVQAGKVILQSDITAISQQDAPQLQGTVVINTPELDPDDGLFDLPENTVDTTKLIVSACTRSLREGSSFIFIGRGGIPPSPTDPLPDEAVWMDLRPTAAHPENRAKKPISLYQSPPTSPEIVEASGWIIAPDGQVTLTAAAPTVTQPSLNPRSCAVIELE